jgi:hypothetical protein
MCLFEFELYNIISPILLGKHHWTHEDEEDDQCAKAISNALKLSVAEFIDPVRELKPASKGMSYEIDFENVDENRQILALTRAAAGF